MTHYVTLRGLLLSGLIVAWTIPAGAQVRVIPGSYLDSTGLTRGSVTLDSTAGRALRQFIATPGAITATPGAAGTLDNGTYAFRLVAVDEAGGTSLPGAEATCVTVAGAGAGSCALSWSAVTGAVSYRIWGSAVGAEDRYQTSTGLSYTWTTAAGATVAALPTVNTAYQFNLGGTVNWFAAELNIHLQNLVTTSTDGLVVANNTAATAAVPVQIPPRLRFRGNVYNTTTSASNTDDWWWEPVPVSGATPSGLFRLASSLNGAAATYPVVVQSNGNVGIGTTLPQNILTVSKSSVGGAVTALSLENPNVNAGTEVILNFGASSAPTIRGAQISAVQDSLGSNQVDMKFLTSTAGAAPTEKVRIKSDGNVGIGTTLPQELLHVGAGVDASDYAGANTLVTAAGAVGLSVRDSTNDVELIVAAISPIGVMGTYTNHSLALRAFNTTVLTLTGAGAVQLGTSTALHTTAPTIASGFGTTPSVVASNGTAAFTVNVGTGGTASAGVLTMPTATTGWACRVENVTGVAANRGDQRTVQRATTTTSVTVQNQTVSTGAALAWTASDVLQLMCFGY